MAVSATVVVSTTDSPVVIQSNTNNANVVMGGPSVTATVAQFADGEVPAGTIDGTNRVFTLAHPPAPASSLKLYKDWLRQPSSAYSLSGSTITYTTAPQVGDTHVADYRY